MKTTSTLPWLAIALLSACSSLDGAGGHPFRDTPAFDSADGATFFVGRLPGESDPEQYDVALGTTDGSSFHTETRFAADVSPRYTQVEVLAVSDQEAWALAQNRLFHREGAGWTEVELPLDRVDTTERINLRHVRVVEGQVVISATYALGDSPSPSQGIWFWLDGGDIEIETLPPGRFDSAGVDDAAGTLRLLSNDARVLSVRAGEITSGDVPHTDSGVWVVSEGIAYGRSETHVTIWDGVESRDEALPIDGDRTNESGDQSETVTDMTVVDGQPWVLLTLAEHSCSGAVFGSHCGYRTRSYRALHRTPEGQWREAIGGHDTDQPDAKIVNIAGEPWLVAPEREPTGVFMGRFASE